MSPELETLDQLLGGDLSLTTARRLFGDEERFIRGLTAMLHAGEVRLLAADGGEVPRWQWREVLAVAADKSIPGEALLSITTAGANRIA
jgi:hypothetical protein